MDSLKVCLGCLSTGVKMFDLNTAGISVPYQKLTGFKLYDYMPQKLCWECAALVNKFNTFRLKCERAHTLLQDTYMMHGEITETTINKIDRELHMLLSHLEAFIPFDEVAINNELDEKTGDDVKNQAVDKIGLDDKPDIESDVKIVKLEELPIKLEFDFDGISIGDSDKNDADDGGESDDLLASKVDEKLDRMMKEIESNKKKKSNKKLTISEELMTQEEATEVYCKKKISKNNIISKYSCDMCYRKYNEESSLNRHKIKHSEAAGNYQCDFCKLRFKTRKKIVRHLSDCHMKKYKCTVCKRVFHNKQSGKDHTEAKCRKMVTASRKRKPNARKRARAKRETRIAGRRPDYSVAIDFKATEESLTQEQMEQLIKDRQNTDNYKTSPFKCALCYKGFLENKTYLHHLLLHDPAAGSYECDICKQRYKTRNKLHKHMSGNHLKKYSCLICNNIFYNRTSAKAHYGWHKGVQYTCHICGTTFRKLSSHLSHLRIKHPSDHICNICSLPFVSPMGLAHHKRIMHSIKSETIQIDSMESGDKEGGHYCPSCQINFDSRQALTRHILISPKHGPVPGIENGCRECGEVFDSKQDLKAHKKTSHPGKFEKKARLHKWEPTPCVECGEMMTSNRKYRAHFSVKHAGEPSPFPPRPYSHVCETCGKGFLCNASLQIHRNVHTGATRYSCKLCPKTFLLPVNLAQHRATHSEERPHVCAVCGKGFKLTTALRRHLKSHTGERPYSCVLCGKSFTSSSGRNAHMRTVHRREPPIHPAYRRTQTALAEHTDVI